VKQYEMAETIQKQRKLLHLCNHMTGMEQMHDLQEQDSCWKFRGGYV
jgi:hypothetical protein